MAKAYWINTVQTVHDDTKLAAYVELAGPAIRAAGGKFLARGDRPQSSRVASRSGPR